MLSDQSMICCLLRSKFSKLRFTSLATKCDRQKMIYNGRNLPPLDGETNQFYSRESGYIEMILSVLPPPLHCIKVLLVFS